MTKCEQLDSKLEQMQKKTRDNSWYGATGSSKFGTESKKATMFDKLCEKTMNRKEKLKLMYSV
jgi:hypothetical protein